MKINVTTLPAQGMRLTYELDGELFRRRLDEGNASPNRLRNNLTFSGIIHSIPDGVELAGTALGTFEQECGRCAEALTRDLKVPVKMVFKRYSGTRPEDDLGIAYFRGDHVEINDVIEEAVIIGLQLHWSPPCEPDGRCSICYRTLADIAAGKPPSSPVDA